MAAVPSLAELLDGHVTLDVLVDVDVGDRRTGILPGHPALELARLVAKRKQLRLRGVQAYAGHASHAMGFERRAKVSQEAKALPGPPAFRVVDVAGDALSTRVLHLRDDGSGEL